MTLAYDRRGSGEPLLLLHGLGMSRLAWQPVLDALNAAGFQTFAVDVPGFGASPPLGRTPTIGALAGAVGGLLDELGLERAHMAGNSMGGAIALELAGGGRASSVTAISPVGLWSARERAFCQASLRATSRLLSRRHRQVSALASSRLGRTLLASQVVARPWQIPTEQMHSTIDAFLGAGAFLATLDAFAGYTVRDSQSLARTPITIAWGTRDRLLLPRQANRGRRLLAHAHHVWLRGLGHVPMWDDHALVAATIINAARAG
jgi:pimeloyl-ACP methyl ester carboxylesterase